MDRILLYQGDSLDTYLKIKNILNDNQIKYEEKIQNGGGGADFLTKLLVFGKGSLGMNEERKQVYHIYIRESDQEKAGMLVKNL